MSSLAGCGGSSSSSPAPDSYDYAAENTESTETTETVATSVDEDSEENSQAEESDEDLYEEIEYKISGTNEFSEGYAWVEYLVSNAPLETKYALINGDGIIKLTSSVTGTRISKGITAWSTDDEFVISDTEGNEHYRFENTPEDSFDVRGIVDGKTIVIEHMTGFSGNQYYLYLVDENGNPATEKIDVTDTYI